MVKQNAFFGGVYAVHRCQPILTILTQHEDQEIAQTFLSELMRIFPLPSDQYIWLQTPSSGHHECPAQLIRDNRIESALNRLRSYESTLS